MIQAKIDQVFLFSLQDPEDPAAARSCVVVADDDQAAHTLVTESLPTAIVLGVTSLSELRNTEKQIRAALDRQAGSWPLLVKLKAN